MPPFRYYHQNLEYLKATIGPLMAMEGYLKLLVIRDKQIPPRRIDPLGHDKFYFTIMGIPSGIEPW